MQQKLAKPESCKTCPGWAWGCRGYVPASGTGCNGVLVIAEAAGEHEADEGMPLVGKAGHFLWQNLGQIGIERADFKVHNVLSCRPPNNKLSGMPYEHAAIEHCAPLLDATIKEMQGICRDSGKTFTIVTLGQIAFKRILGLKDRDPLLKEDYICYPFWSDRYNAWVIAVDHPSYLMRGKTELLRTLQFGFKRALEIADNALTLDTPDYLLDPSPTGLAHWALGYFQAVAASPDTTLSYDIETPHKQGADEDSLGKEAEELEDGDDYRIIRISFSYKPNEAVSVPWQADYLPVIEELFARAPRLVGWNNNVYDDPRIMATVPINGDRLDAMQMWHVLNSDLPKALGFVTPYYVPTTAIWKNLSSAQPAFYNAKDADMALRCYHGIKRDLTRSNLWPVYERHVVEVHRVFNYMSAKGVPFDLELRAQAEKDLQRALDDVEADMETTIPREARKLKVYKKVPKDLTGLVEVPGLAKVKRCSVCGQGAIKKAHFKQLKRGPVNPCALGVVTTAEEPTQLWAKPLEFKVSKKSLMNYQAALRHQAVISRRERKITFDEKAILQLVKKYPKDPLYPLILRHRKLQKLLGTYIGTTKIDGTIRGGMPVGPDGNVHTLFTSNPSTLRSASQNPNLQNIPRPSKVKDDPSNIVRNLFRAWDGWTLTAADYSGIEAVLVGYFALAPQYVRLAKMDVHSFYTAYALHELDGRVRGADLPLVTWDDSRLKARLGEIKAEFSHDRNNLYKHLVHAINFGQSPKGAQEKILLETGVTFDVGLIKRVMDVYKELFPEIPRWQQNLLYQVEKNGHKLSNPFGYVHRFSRPFDYERVGGKWQKSPGSDCNKIWAFLPQSTAAGIIKEALLRLYHNHYEAAGQFLRLLIHDELFFHCPMEVVTLLDAVVKQEMERPIEVLPLPASYGMGSHLIINTEAKRGLRWGSMR